MRDLVQLGLYELVWNCAPMPDATLLARLISPHTRRTYKLAIDKFYWRVEREPRLAKRPAIEDYRAVLLLAYAPAVAALHLRIVRELYDEAIATGILRENPVAGVPPPMISPDPGVQVPSRDEALGRLEHCRCTSEAGRRERALCLLVSQVAVAPEEVRALQVHDYAMDEGQGVILVRRGEGREAVRLPLPPEVANALDAYLVSRSVADDSPLFRSARSRGKVQRRLARGAAARRCPGAGNYPPSGQV